MVEKPDSAGYVHVTWPSKSIPHGGIFHTKVVEPSPAQQNFLKVLLEESKLSIVQRQKAAWGLRQEDEVNEPPRRRCVPLVRPRTSKRRSLSAIRESGIYEDDLYRPTKRGEDREKLKDKLANTMAYGDRDEQTPPPALKPRAVKQAPKLPTDKEIKNDLLTQIRERAEWLAEMEDLGQAGQHREIIHDQIAERLRALDALGIDSQCTSARSSVSGFSTLRSQKVSVGQKINSSSKGSAKSASSNYSSGSQNSKKAGYLKGSARNRQKKEENVTEYSKLSPLQYSPRRRV